MHTAVPRWLPLLVAVTALTACATPARLPVSAGTGPSPTLPEPERTLIPMVRVVKAVGWTQGGAPTPASDLEVTPFARGLDHPRWLLVLPNGDVLVAETNGPVRPKDSAGLKGKVFMHLQRRAAGDEESADRITLLRDADGDGVAETRALFATGLRSPFGRALVGDDLYVANTDAVVRFDYRAGALRVDGPGEKIVDLPAGPLNHHWTKSLIASPDGTKLYVGVGSNSNAAEHGLVVEQGRAAVWEIDLATRGHRVFASGLRNPVGMAWEPVTGALWVAVNERDELGSDLVPDYMTALHDGAFYGWPYSWFGDHLDPRVPPRPDLVARAVVPDYALGPHTASLGLAWSGATSLPARFNSGMFVGQHGSWNRAPRSGYKVVFVPFADGRPAGPPEDVLTGFYDGDGDAWGRPVGVAIDARGGLLVADDAGDAVWRVGGAGARTTLRHAPVSSPSE